MFGIGYENKTNEKITCLIATPHQSFWRW